MDNRAAIFLSRESYLARSEKMRRHMQFYSLFMGVLFSDHTTTRVYEQEVIFNPSHDLR